MREGRTAPAAADTHHGRSDVHEHDRVHDHDRAHADGAEAPCTAWVVTVSDRGARGEREDASGPALVRLLREHGYNVVGTSLVPDEEERIRAAILEAAGRDVALVLTTGGTGFSPRDVTPEATASVCERMAPGIPEAMRAASLRITPMACLSREVAGIVGRTLVVNLPGSPKAAVENVSAVIEPIAHGLRILRGGPADCARERASREGLAARKRELRRRLLDLRRDLGAEARAAADASIARRVTSLGEYADATAVLTYLSVGDEVQTRDVIRDAWSRGKVVALPRCVPHSRRMRWYRVTSLDGLEHSPFGVLEPVADASAELDPAATPCALAIVPGLTFDARGYRLGYGGGFYDVFLAGFGGASVGLCREAQLSEGGVGALDGHDLPVGIVVTERRVIRAS